MAIQSLKHRKKECTLKQGDVVLIKGEERNRGKWKIGVVDQMFEGRDGVIRAVRLRAGKSFMERPVQHLYPLELSCDIRWKPQLNVEAREFSPKRKAAKAARDNIRIIAEEENDF